MVENRCGSLTLFPNMGRTNRMQSTLYDVILAPFNKNETWAVLDLFENFVLLNAKRCRDLDWLYFRFVDSDRT